MKAKGGISREGEYIIIRIPVEDAQSLRVAMHPCGCRAPKSNSTADIRDRIIRGLGRALSREG